MKILVADDDPVSSRLMQRILERFGYSVTVVHDGRAACQELSYSDAPRLALIDWMMPEMDGPEVCRAVRQMKDQSYTYIILLTSKESSEDVVEGLDAGADDYLTKPCNPAELRARLQTGRRILELEDKLVEAREGMRFRATHDGLTQLLNRSAILSVLRESLERSHAEDRALSILLCDIDHFKRINDQHGHLAGDAVLEHFAARLRHTVRGKDSVGRYGGEEFLVILEGCDKDDLAVRAEHMRRNIAEKPFSTPGPAIPVTTSIGGATLRPGGPLVSPEAILSLADTLLYQAKAEGRNTVRIAAAAASAPQAEQSALFSIPVPA